MKGREKGRRGRDGGGGEEKEIMLFRLDAEEDDDDDDDDELILFIIVGRGWSRVHAAVAIARGRYTKKITGANL
jgi:hypothetical protein